MCFIAPRSIAINGMGNTTNMPDMMMTATQILSWFYESNYDWISKAEYLLVGIKTLSMSVYILRENIRPSLFSRPWKSSNFKFVAWRIEGSSTNMSGLLAESLFHPWKFLLE